MQNESTLAYRGQAIVMWQEAGMWLAILRPINGLTWPRRSVPPGFYQQEVIENARQAIDDELSEASDTL